MACLFLVQAKNRTRQLNAKAGLGKKKDELLFL